MKIRYLKLDKTIRQFEYDSVDINEQLKAGVYQMGVDQMGIYLAEEDTFKLPIKLYGDVIKNSDRILKTFSQRSKSTGVLLNGLKGSGKTITAKYICNEAVHLGMPVILVNNKMPQPMFNDFLKKIAQECVVFFDEFEKTHSTYRGEDEDDEQEDLLTLLDGVSSTKKLLIFTCNDEGKINEFMINRPARIYYNIKYGSLSIDEIKEFAEDNLTNKEALSNLLLADSLVDFSYDILNSLIEELNIHNCDVSEALEIMNIKMDKSQSYDVISITNVDGVPIDESLYNMSYASGSLLGGISIDLRDKRGNSTSWSQKIRIKDILSDEEGILKAKYKVKWGNDKLSEKFNGEQIITLSKRDNAVISYKDYCRAL